jgi:hypothetical protein
LTFYSLQIEKQRQLLFVSSLCYSFRRIEERETTSFEGVDVNEKMIGMEADDQISRLSSSLKEYLF